MPGMQDDVIRQQIIDNLKVLNISEESANRMMDAVDNMRGKDHIKGALKFLTQITDSKSQREERYQHSTFIAEYFCTLSNLGMFAVGFYYEDFAVLLAATFSAISHAVPFQRFLELDKLGVLVIFAKVIGDYKILMERPELLAWGAGALTVNVLDTMISRGHLNKISASLHSAWHLAAALALYKIDQASIEVSSDEVKLVAAAALANELPGFLSEMFAVIKNFTQSTYGSNCTIV